MSEGGAGGRLPRARRWSTIVALLTFTALSIAVGLEATTLMAFEAELKPPLQRYAMARLVLPTFVIGVLLLGLFGLLGSLRRAVPLGWMAGFLLIVVNHLKIQARAEPLYPSDFMFVGEAELLISSVGVQSTVLALAAVLGVGVIAWVVVVGVGRLLRIPSAGTTDDHRWVRAFRGGSVLVAAALVAGIVSFNADDNPLKASFEGAGAEWISWSQRENYLTNGFFSGFLYNMPSVPMRAPVGYGREAVMEAVARNTEKAREINQMRHRTALDDTNIIIILGESFIDPLALDGLELAEDPIPFIRDLKSRTLSGSMRSVAFGGGTANIEFEVLTGMAMSNFSNPLPPFQGLVANAERFPSVLTRLKETHTTLGIHPYFADFYRRADSYRSLGFDTAKFQDEMSSTWRISPAEYAHASDAAAYAELMDDLRAHDEPVFANVVTMQNHAGYHALYPDPIPVLEPASARESPDLGQYLRGLRHADTAMETLLAELASLDEPTVVLFYGDHAPSGVIPDDVWDSQPNPDARYRTPWFVWSTEGVHTTEDEDLPGPLHLWNQLLRAIAAPVTPWDALLLELASVSAVDEGLASTQADGCTSGQHLVECEHLLLQYDMAVGAGHGTDTLLTVP